MRFNFSHVALCLACLAFRPAFAGEDIVADENAIEAAFIYNFALFTEWQELPSEKFRICVLGGDQILVALESLTNKQIKNHPIRVTMIVSPNQALSCQVLFVGQTEHASIHNLASQLGNAPVLVIAEEDDYNPKDVIISLVKLQGRIGFKINLTAAEAHSMTVSSKLLKLALQVY
jgi:rRNA-processing protein FCF1